ncbi:MAG: DUF1887 family protein [Verrucomicrobia bacterium]|nr:DUF1887 family protein [Verrucomicrobiota bacterium]
MNLLSLASKQIWPQVLAAAHLKPAQFFLLHSEDLAESRGPAQRLKRFFDNSGLVPKGGTRLEEISDSDFNAVERRLDELAATRQFNLGDCVLNFTGGNKLMATATFRWAARRGVRAFYLERRNQLTWFEPRDGDMFTRPEPLNGHRTDDLDPVALLCCQLDASEVQRPGQTLVLNEAGQKLTADDFFRRIQNGNDARPWLSFTGEADRSEKEGDSLEFAVAATLLKLGVKQVQRSLRLKVKSTAQVGTRLPHAEIDLLFTWGGRLWLVDCKDRMPAEDLVVNLRRHLPRSLNSNAQELLDRIQKELSIGQTKVMKEDLLAVREAGGLLGNVVCVRKAELPEEVLQFARHNHIAVVRKACLVTGLRDLLDPDRPADGRDLASLAAHFRK